MDSVKEEWRSKPSAVVRELADVCRASNPSEQKRIRQKKHVFHMPVAQCHLDILPAASDGEGTLQVEARPYKPISQTCCTAHTSGTWGCLHAELCLGRTTFP